MRLVLLLYQLWIVCYRKAYLLLVAFFVSLYANAVAHDLIADARSCDSVFIFQERILFPRASAIVSGGFAGNQKHLDSIRSFFSKADAEDFINVRVVGSYSPEGEYSFNKTLAEARALALKDVAKRYNADIEPAVIVISPPPFRCRQTGNTKRDTTPDCVLQSCKWSVGSIKKV